MLLLVFPAYPSIRLFFAACDTSDYLGCICPTARCVLHYLCWCCYSTFDTYHFATSFYHQRQFCSVIRALITHYIPVRTCSFVHMLCCWIGGVQEKHPEPPWGQHSRLGSGNVQQLNCSVSGGGDIVCFSRNLSHGPLFLRLWNSSIVFCMSQQQRCCCIFIYMISGLSSLLL